jgi:hypothetical protein
MIRASVLVATRGDGGSPLRKSCSLIAIHIVLHVHVGPSPMNFADVPSKTPVNSIHQWNILWVTQSISSRAVCNNSLGYVPRFSLFMTQRLEQDFDEQQEPLFLLDLKRSRLVPSQYYSFNCIHLCCTACCRLRSYYYGDGGPNRKLFLGGPSLLQRKQKCQLFFPSPFSCAPI